MVRSAIYKKLLSEVSLKEQQLAVSDETMIGQAAAMITFLKGVMAQNREQVCKTGFSGVSEEVEFFRSVKPQILGKLIFYNDVYSIETTCPVQGGKLYRKYFNNQLKKLKQNNASHTDIEFYRYYRSGRTDRDTEFFQRGQTHFSMVPESFYFEMDAQYCTYYDHLVARIIAQDLLYFFLLSRIDPENALRFAGFELPEDMEWTETKNALIELVYALYCSGAVNHGKMGLRKLSQVFQNIFKIPLGDIHHAFHRMKNRTGSRTIFLDQLRDSLDNYMDKEL